MINNTVVYDKERLLAPWIPTPTKIIALALALADVNQYDKVVDIGCGDGRVPIIAAKYLGAKGVCVEISENLCALSLANAIYNKVIDNFKLLCKDGREVDYSEYSVIFLYMFKSVNKIIAEKLDKELKKGARVITIDFPIPDWIPVTLRKTLDERNIERTIYLYIIGISNPSSWRPSKFEKYPEKPSGD